MSATETQTRVETRHCDICGFVPETILGWRKVYRGVTRATHQALFERPLKDGRPRKLDMCDSHATTLGAMMVAQGAEIRAFDG